MKTTARVVIALALAAGPLVPAAAQEGAPKPRLELADSARKAQPQAAHANRPTPNTAVAAGAPADVTPAPAAPAPRDVAFRRDFVRNQAALGVMLYGPALATSITDDPLPWTASYLLVAGMSFVATAEVSRNVTVTDPMQRLATGLPIRGAIAGSLLSAALHGDSRSTAGAVFLGSIGGTAAGVWRGRHMDDGQAAATLFGSDLLGLAGYGVATAAGLEDRGGANTTRLWMTVGGMVAGAPLGQAYAALAPYNVTVGDLNAMMASGGVGMLAGLAVVANGPRNDRHLAGAMTAGALAGLAVGDRLLTRRYDHTPDEGRYMIAGGVAGGLMGAGVALLTGGSRDRWSAYTGAFTTAGAAAGVAWTQYYFRPRADGVARISGLTFSPFGVVAAASGVHGSYSIANIRF